MDTRWLLLIPVTMSSGRHSLLPPSSLHPTPLQLILFPVARALCLELTSNRLKNYSMISCTFRTNSKRVHKRQEVGAGLL